MEIQPKKTVNRPYNALNVITDFATGGVEYADVNVATKRMEVCKACPKFNATMKVCKGCGCYLPTKVKFLRSQCPDEKW